MRVLMALVAGGVLAAGCGGGDSGAPAASGSAAGSGSASPSGAGITVTSKAFAAGRQIPERFSCLGAGDAPDLAWTGIPAGAASVALVVNDPDAGSDGFLHWIVYGLPPRDGALSGAQPPAGATEADNSGGEAGWTPPCPPSGSHHYVFSVYALSAPPSGDTPREIATDIDRKAVARGELTGLFGSG